jgi:hypothetical protein
LVLTAVEGMAMATVFASTLLCVVAVADVALAGSAFLTSVLSLATVAVSTLNPFQAASAVPQSASEALFPVAADLSRASAGLGVAVADGSRAAAGCALLVGEAA